MASIGLSAAGVARPADDAARHGAGIPCDVRDGWFGPREIGIGVGANKRNVTRHADTTVNKKLYGRIKETNFVKNKRGRRGVFE